MRSRWLSSRRTSSPVLWLKYPHTACLTTSTSALLRARRAKGSASTRSTKQSSPSMLFSPTHVAVEKRFAVDFGSRPCVHHMPSTS
jgi:hypothetical protein